MSSTDGFAGITNGYGRQLGAFLFDGIPEYGVDRVVRVAFRATDRRAIETAVDRLIAMLDAIDGDPDLEDDRVDDEDGGDAEPDSDGEPSLGAVNHVHQGLWGVDGYQDGDDREHDEGDRCEAEDGAG